MWLHMDWAAANASCRFSITAEIWGKREDSSRIYVRITENGVFMKNWQPFCFRPPRGGVRREARKSNMASSNLSLFMWCVSARREQSNATERWLIFQRQSQRAASRKWAGAVRRSHLWAGLRDSGRPSPGGDPDQCDNKTMTSQVRRAPPPCRQALTTSGRLIHSRSHRTGFCFTWRNRWDLNPASTWTLDKTEWKHAGAKSFVSSWSGC